MGFLSDGMTHRTTILFQRQDRYGYDEFGNENSGLMEDDQRRYVHYFLLISLVLTVFYSTGHEWEEMKIVGTRL